VYCNAAFTRITGYQPAEVIGRNCRFLQNQDRDQPPLAEVRAALAAGRECQVVLRNYRRDGTLFWNELTLAPVRDGQGRVSHFVGVQNDITARVQSESRLRELTMRLENLREEESLRLARKIHDELGQHLTALRWDLAWVKEHLPDQPLLLRQKVAGLDAVVDGLIKAVRHIAMELRPALLDDLGLVPAIDWLVREYRQRTGLACRFQARPGEGDPGPERTAAVALYRILQEAMTNILRHAKAQRVDILLRREPQAWVLEIKDDGVGISPAQLEGPGSLGLLGMRERALGVGGTLAVRAAPDRGTVVEVRVPLS
nr:PAS domain-containing protein [Pseudomonadota bacterium]